MEVFSTKGQFLDFGEVGPADELRPASLTHHRHVSKEDCGRSAQKLEEQEDVNVGRERRAQAAHQQDAHGEQDGQAAAIPEDTAEDSVSSSRSPLVMDSNPRWCEGRSRLTVGWQ